MAKIKYDFNPFALTGESAKGLGDKKEEVLIQIADLITETIKERAAGQLSTVSRRGKWKSLSTAYAKSKKGGDKTANLTLTGDMLGSLNTHQRSGNTLRTTVGEDEQEKADGHNNFSGKSSLPLRRFVPDGEDGETWNKNLIEAMRNIIRQAKEE